MRLEVDKELIPMKGHFFLFNAGTAPVVPFMTTLARQLGFSTVTIGTMYTVLPVVGMLAKPLFGYIADRFQKHRTLFLASQLLTAISFFCIMFIPEYKLVPQVELHCHEGFSEMMQCSDKAICMHPKLEAKYGNSTLSCKLHCRAEPWMWDIVCDDWMKNATNCPKTNPFLNLNIETNIYDLILEKECLFFKIQKDRATLDGENVVMQCTENRTYFKTTCDLTCGEEYMEQLLAENSEISNSEAWGMYQFWMFFLLLITSWVGMAVVVSIGDAICFALLGDRHHQYGKQRLWGAVGWGIFAILSGILVDTMSGDSVHKDYTIVFWMTAFLIGGDIFVSSKLKNTQTNLSQSIFHDVGRLLVVPRVAVFFIWCIFIGLCTALVWNFLFIHLEDLSQHKSSCTGDSIKTLEGFVMGIQCFGGELPFFFLSGWILKKIGHVNAMSLVLLGFGVRFLFYSFLVNPWYALPIEFLNGVTFGMFYSTMASYASIVAPSGSEATLQGLVGAIFEGVGVSIGSLIGGLMFNAVGGSTTFFIFSMASFIALIIHAVVQKILPKFSKESASAKYLAPSDAMHMLEDQEYIAVS